MSNGNPCLDCGACCAYFRCSFYHGEADDLRGGTVPAELTEPVTPFRHAMRTVPEAGRRRCIALAGEIGKSVQCTIYLQRSTVCRAFPFSWEDGVHNPRCDQARIAWGLPPLPPPTGVLAPPAILPDTVVAEEEPDMVAG